MSWLDRAYIYGSCLMEGRLPNDEELENRERQMEGARERARERARHIILAGNVGYDVTRLSPDLQQSYFQCMSAQDRFRVRMAQAHPDEPILLPNPGLCFHQAIYERFASRLNQSIMARLARTGFLPVASMECGVTMSCEPSADLNPSVSRLSMIRELLPARLEELRNDLSPPQRQSLDDLLGTFDEIPSRIRPEREREQELIERLRQAPPELMDEIRSRLSPEGRLLLEELLSGRPH